MLGCERCTRRRFINERALNQHLESSSAHHFCPPCNIDFPTDEGLKVHDESEHYWCRSCDKFFRSDSNLRNHLKSSKHRPRDILCPFNCESREGPSGFVSYEAMVLHLDGGACTSRITREEINNAIRKADNDNLVTVPSEYLDGYSSYDEIATENAWDGDAYACHLCRGTFTTLLGLNQHLASPFHRAKIYRCILHSRPKKFATLSAWYQHANSGQHEYRSVQRAMDFVAEEIQRWASRGR